MAVCESGEPDYKWLCQKICCGAPQFGPHRLLPTTSSPPRRVTKVIPWTTGFDSWPWDLLVGVVQLLLSTLPFQPSIPKCMTRR